MNEFVIKYLLRKNFLCVFMFILKERERRTQRQKKEAVYLLIIFECLPESKCKHKPSIILLRVAMAIH